MKKFLLLFLLLLCVPTFAQVSHTSSSGVSSGDSTTKGITQTTHGFVAGDILRKTSTAGVYAKALADTAANAEVVGIVSSSPAPTTNTFTLIYSGNVAGLSGLTEGTAYFLSATTAGAMQATDPGTASIVSKPVLVATSATTGVFVNFRGLFGGGGLAPLPNSVSFTTAGSFTYTPSFGARKLFVRMAGGGGGGAGCSALTATTQASAGSGGASGGYVEFEVSGANILSSFSITVGGGGGGGAISVNGGNGGSSLFGAYVTAGGGGGGFQTGVVSVPAVVTSNVGGTVTINTPAAVSVIRSVTGRLGGATATTNQATGLIVFSTGSSTPFGHGAAQVMDYAPTPAAGLAGALPASNWYGSGGAGNATANIVATGRNGSNGIQGAIFITEYF